MMDLFTHLIIGYAVAIFLNRGRRERTALVVGSIVPDLDAFLMPIVYLCKWLYPLSHRGATHSLLVAGPLAASALYTTSSIKPRFPGRIRQYLDPVEYSPRLAAYAVIGAMLHVLLDLTTIMGAPLLYPLSDVRITYNLFFFSEPSLFLVALIITAAILRGNLKGGRLRMALVGFILLILIMGGARIMVMPPGDAYPTPNLLEWWLIEEDREGTIIYKYTCPGDLEVAARFDGLPMDWGVRDALDVVRSTPEYSYFLWNSHSPPIAEVNREEGGYLITFFDPVRKAALENSSLGPLLNRLEFDGTSRFFVKENVIEIKEPELNVDV